MYLHYHTENIKLLAKNIRKSVSSALLARLPLFHLRSPQKTVNLDK